MKAALTITQVETGQYVLRVLLPSEWGARWVIEEHHSVLGENMGADWGEHEGGGMRKATSVFKTLAREQIERAAAIRQIRALVALFYDIPTADTVEIEV